MKGDECILSVVLFIILIARFPSQARLENPSAFSVYRVRSLSKQLIASAAHLRALVFSEENRIPSLGDVSISTSPTNDKQHKRCTAKKRGTTAQEHEKKTQTIFYSIVRASSVFTNSARSRVFCLLLSRFLTRPTYTRAQASQRDCVLQRTTFCSLSFVHLHHKSKVICSRRKRRKQQ